MRSAIVVRVNNLNQLAKDLNESVPGTALNQSVMFQNLNAFVDLLAELNTKHTNKVQAYGGFDQYGAGKYGWVWSLNADDLPTMNKTELAPMGTVESREYSGSEIVQFTKGDFTFFFAVNEGLLLLSVHENLVEAALKQLENKLELGKNDAFQTALKTTSAKDPANVLVQWHAVPDWLNTQLAAKIEWPGTFSTWSALDLDINQNDINLTGMSLATDSANVYLGLFNGTGSGSAKFTEIIPENAALAVSQTCGNYSSWHSNFETYLGKHNRDRARDNQLKNLGIDPKLWMDATDEEIGIFYNDGSGTSAEAKNGFIRMADAEEMSSLLSKISGGETTEYRGKTISKVTSRLALPLIYGRLFSYLSEPYWFLHDDWVILSNTMAGSKAAVNTLLAGKTWQNAASSKTFSPYVDSDANLTVVAKNPEWFNLILKELNAESAKALKPNKKTLGDVNWVVASVKQKGELAYSELIFLHQTKTTASAKQYWAVDLDQPAIGQPQLVKNHYTKQNEVLIQDEAHNLYLIDPTGKVLWKRGLDGAILGKVTQVDLYKNNKLQLVFNTAQRVYILDRNGKDVGAFPITLKQTATAPMAVFDYEKTRKYRFVVPCGKRLLNYDRNGKPVKGWNHKKAKSTLILQPKHAVIQGRDFIYTADNQGRVYLLNRRGEVRENIKSRMPNLASEMYLVYDKNVGGKLGALSKSGYTLSLFMNDQLDSIQPFNDKPLFMTVNGRTQIFGAENEIYKRDDAANFDIDLDNDLTVAPEYFVVGGRKLITATTSDNEVWVFDEMGKPLPGMPVYGSGQATIGKTAGKSIHLFVTTTEGEVLDYILGK